MMYDPYNNSREFKPWGGEDCSYLHPYASASTVKMTYQLMGVMLLGATISQLMAAMSEPEETKRIEDSPEDIFVDNS